MLRVTVRDRRLAKPLTVSFPKPGEVLPPVPCCSNGLLLAPARPCPEPDRAAEYFFRRVLEPRLLADERRLTPSRAPWKRYYTSPLRDKLYQWHFWSEGVVLRELEQATVRPEEQDLTVMGQAYLLFEAVTLTLHAYRTRDAYVYHEALVAYACLLAGSGAQPERDAWLAELTKLQEQLC